MAAEDPHLHLGHFSGLGMAGLGTTGLGTTGLGTTGYEGRRASAIHQVNKCTACYLQ